MSVCVLEEVGRSKPDELFDAAAGLGGYRESGYGRVGGKEVRILCTLFCQGKVSIVMQSTTNERYK